MAHAVWNGASMEIVDDDEDDLIDVEQNPFGPDMVSQDAGGAQFFQTYEQSAPGDGITADKFDDRELGDELQDEVVPQLEQAAVGADGRPVGDLIQLARADDLRQRAREGQSPYRNPNPESARRGLLGGQAVVNPSQEPQQVVFWEGESVETRTVSVAFFPLTGTGGPSGGTTVRPFVRLRFGTHDGQTSLDMDVGRGGQIAVPCCSMYVAVGMESGDAAFRLGACIGFNPMVRTTPATRTRYVNNQASATTQNIVRPAFGQVLYFERSDVATQFTLAFRDAYNVVIYRRVIASNVYQEQPIIVSNDVENINVTNDGPNTSSFRAVFGLAL